MAEFIREAAKKPEAERENSPSQTQKKGPSQSISSPVEQILFLQRTIGNQAVVRLIKSGALQAKLRIGQPGDVYEREADRVAEQMMRMPEPQVLIKTKVSSNTQNNSIQRRCPGCNNGMKSEKEEEEILKKEATGTNPEVTLELDSNISTVLDGGHILSGSTSDYFEPLFMDDFSQVQVQRVSPIIQRKEGVETSGWADTSRRARKARKSGDIKEAERLYKETIVMSVPSVVFPANLAKTIPKPEDIRLDFKLTDFAETRSKEVPVNEIIYWRWIYFGPDSVKDTQAHTEAVITHELVHVNQYEKIWKAYKSDKSVSKPSWEEYIKPYSRKERVLGPEELEAEVTSLDFLMRLSKDEQVLALRGLFVAYIHTSAYKPAKGETTAITTAVTGPRILDFYKKADAKIQERMGAELWWSLVKAETAKEIWQVVLRELKPIAVKGYNDATFRPLYDEFLKEKDLKFSEIITDSKKGGTLQKRAEFQDMPVEAPHDVEGVLRSPGQPLDPVTRAFFEPRFGQDFSQVRVHADAQAAEAARAVNARAFTVGPDVVFEQGQYAPATTEGNKLLAHELTHVVQQQTSRAFIQRQQGYFDPGGVPDQLEILWEGEGLPLKLYREPEIRRLSFSEKTVLSFQRKLGAIIKLGDLRHKNAVYTLVKVVENKLYVAPKGFTATQKLLLQQEAVIALGKIGTPEAIKKLTDLLNSKDPKERLMAARGFSGASGKTMPYWHVVPSAQVGTILLAKLKQETDAGIKSQIIFALGNVGSGLSSNKEKQLIVMELIRVMEKSTGTVQTAAIKALGRIRLKSATESLLKQLKLWHSIDAMAQEIIFALGEIGDVRAVEYLVIFLEKHGSKSVRSQAAIALGKIGGAKALAALKRRLTLETDPDVKANISKALP